MTHLHIPSLPPFPRRTPRRRRMVPPDSANTATCSGCAATGSTMFVKTFCPRHDAVSYATHMARHATDSIMGVL